MATEFNYEGAAKAIWGRQFFNERWEDAPDVLKDEFRSEAKASVAAFLADNKHNIEREDGEVVSGGFSTAHDAWIAREWVEKALAPETFWIRRAGGEHE